MVSNLENEWKEEEKSFRASFWQHIRHTPSYKHGLFPMCFKDNNCLAVRKKISFCLFFWLFKLNHVWICLATCFVLLSKPLCLIMEHLVQFELESGFFLLQSIRIPSGNFMALRSELWENHSFSFKIPKFNRL